VLDTGLGPVALHNGSRPGTGRSEQPFNTAVPLAHIVADLVGAGVTEMLSELSEVAPIKTFPMVLSPNQGEGNVAAPPSTLVAESVPSPDPALRLDHAIRPEGRYMLEGKRRAVIIGINNYQDNSITALHGAENDASELYELLKNPQIGNFHISNDHYLTGEQGKCEKIRKAISDIFWKADHTDLALFYFSGHGFVDNYGNGYIAPYNITKDEPFVCGISMQELKEVISKSNSTCVLVILDCCYSGIATKGVKSAPDFRTIYEEHLKDLSGEGRIILASSEEDKLSRETDLKHSNTNEPPHFHGVFTYQLIEGLQGIAADETGIITLNKLLAHVEEHSKRLSNQKLKLFPPNVTKMGAVKIAISPQKYNGYIEMVIKEAETFYNNQDTASIFSAVKMVQNIVDMDVKHDRITNLQDSIKNRLLMYRDRATHWLTFNELDVRPYISNIYPKLESLRNDISFERIAVLDRDKKIYLLLLCKVSVGEIDNKQFVEYCLQLEQPPSQKPIIGTLR
jgi:hypothetical protein